MWRHMKRCHGCLHYNRKFQIFIFLIGHINVNKGFFCLIINYLQIKSYNVLNYNNCSTDWPFPLTESKCICIWKSLTEFSFFISIRNPRWQPPQDKFNIGSYFFCLFLFFYKFVLLELLNHLLANMLGFLKLLFCH